MQNPDKFCHGFGVFQRDIQFFENDPAYFLQKKYERFGDSLEQCLGELRRVLTRVGLADRSKLSDEEFAKVAIAYNTGHFDPTRGLKQGFQDGDGRFYGEQVFDFVRLSRTVEGPPQIAPPLDGQAIMPPPTPVAGPANFKVATTSSPLRLRSEPAISDRRKRRA